MEHYTSFFSKTIAKKLYNVYRCGALQPIFNVLSRRFDEIYNALVGDFHVFDIRLETTSRLLIHTKSHYIPGEMSLAWDFIFNVPYIPSSALKGVARTYFEENKVTINGLGIDDIFGSQGSEGLVVFVDAYPISCKESLVELDVITPHYSEVKYSIDEASSSPTPVVFITVARNVVFRTLLLVNTEIHGENVKPSVVDDIVRNIIKAFALGVGAKTSLGYGRFRTSAYSSRTYK